MRQNWFPGGLHSSDIHQELDFHLPAFLRSWTGKRIQTAQPGNYPVKILAQRCTEQTEVKLNATQTFSLVLTCVANWIYGCFFFFFKHCHGVFHNVLEKRNFGLWTLWQHIENIYLDYLFSCLVNWMCIVYFSYYVGCRMALLYGYICLLLYLLLVGKKNLTLVHARVLW